MNGIGFDNDKYLTLQSQHIRQRIAQFGGKLYLEFGGKLYDDNHAARVLPGFQPDSKLRMLLQLKDKVEMVIAINAADIEKNKVRGDLGITYDRDVIRLIDVFRGFGLYVSSVVLTRFADQALAKAFQARLEGMGIRVYHHYAIAGYPGNIPHIVSDEGYGKNEYIETTRPIVVMTAPGPGSGKTTVIVLKILKYIFVDDIKPNEILATTFTKKAAEELKSRINAYGKAVLGHTKGFAHMYVGTIHGFCIRMLQNYIPEFQKFTVLDEIQTKLFVERYYEECGMQDLELKKYIDYYNNERISMKLKGMSPVQYRTHSQAS